MVQTNSLDSKPTPINPFDLKAYLAERRAQVEAALDQALALRYPETLYEAMRLRPRDDPHHVADPRRSACHG